ncbi:MAG: hypothetical protein ACI31E_02300 [Muribaculaceae bacterium]
MKTRIKDLRYKGTKKAGYKYLKNNIKRLKKIKTAKSFGSLKNYAEICRAKARGISSSG